MQLNDRTILITGGSEGVGFELAKALAPRNTVIVCERSAAKLDRARAEIPALRTRVCDVTEPDQRRALRASVVREDPSLDILINNAGGRVLVDLVCDSETVIAAALRRDLELDFVAPASLCAELLEHLRSRPSAAIVNVTTGLALLPKAAQPFYCAAKSALHSYTRSLRWALRDSTVSVHEALLPLVATNFHERELPDTMAAITAEQAAREMLSGLARDRPEIGVGKAKFARWLDFVAPRRGMAIVNRPNGRRGHS